MAESPPDELLEPLRQQLLIGGKFEQTRALQGLPRPIVSSGKFLFWRDHGLYWETLLPFYQATTFTTDETLQWLSPQGPAETGNARDPAQKYISRILLAVFSADLRAIDNLFDSSWQIDGNSWQVELTPANRTVAKFIERAILSGDQYIRQLQITSHNGDSNTVHFDDISAPAQGTAERCSRFSTTGELRCPNAP